jgi:hypothetical protein
MDEMKAEYRYQIFNLHLYHETAEGEPDYDKPAVGNYTGTETVANDGFNDSTEPMHEAFANAVHKLRIMLGQDSPFSGWYGVAMGYIQEEGDENQELYLLRHQGGRI